MYHFDIWMSVMIEGYKFSKPFPITNDPKEIENLVDHFYTEWFFYLQDQRSQAVSMQDDSLQLRREFEQAYAFHRNNPSLLKEVIKDIKHRYRHFWKPSFMDKIALEERDKYDEMHG